MNKTKGIAIIIVSVLLFISCKEEKTNSISISIYKTETTEKLYHSIYYCDSLTNELLHQNPIDTSSLEVGEEIRLRDGVSKSIFNSISVNPILGRLSDVYYKDSTNYKFTSSIILGVAYCRDTAQISSWLAQVDCLKKPDYTYKWLVDSNSIQEAKLIGIKSNIPILTFKYSDIDSIKLSPVTGIFQMMDKFTNEKTDPNSYSLDVVFKQSTISLLRNEMKKDSNSGYIALVKSGQFIYYYVIKRDFFQKNTFKYITMVNKKDLDNYMNRFDTRIVEIKY